MSARNANATRDDSPVDECIRYIIARCMERAEEEYCGNLSLRGLRFLRRWEWGDGRVVVMVVFQEVGGRVGVKENVYDDVLFDDSTSIKRA